MTDTMTDSPLSCVGHVYLSDEGAVEGWCVYPDRPDERATVEFLVNGVVVRAMRATRPRLDRSGLGMGDGYCGFSFPFSAAKAAQDERVILEVREHRLNSIIGRVILGQNDAAAMRRLRAAAATLEMVDTALARREHGNSPVIQSMQFLGQTLLHLSGRPRDTMKSGLPCLQAGLEHVAAIPAMDLGWRPNPRFSLIIRAAGDVFTLAGRIRSIAAAVAGLGAEFILLDDGTCPWAALLPTRLRHLALVSSAPSDRPGVAFNAAAAVARGTFLIFPRRDGPRPAGLREALKEAGAGKLGLDANFGDLSAAKPDRLARHGLGCIVSAKDFSVLGGFELVRREEEMWAILIAKARALGLKIAPWAARRPGRPLAG